MLGRAVKRIYILVILTTAVDPDGAKAGTQDGDTPSARCLPPARYRPARYRLPCPTAHFRYRSACYQVGSAVSPREAIA